MTSALVAGVVAGYGVALPVGAVAAYLVGLGARKRLRISAAAALGVATTDGFFASVAAVGGVGLQTANSGSTLIAAAVFAVGAFLTSASWQLFLAGSGAALRRLITGARGQLAVALISGAIMIALAGNLLVS